MNRGIYLVANRRSEREAANLVHSLRQAGCRWPIALIPFDDDLPTHPRLRAETTLLDLKSFPREALELLGQIAALWPKSRPGLFRRMLAWYGPFDEFIYSDNDIVALGDWTPYLDRLGVADLLHADVEYTTGGIFAYKKPVVVVESFGPAALDSVFTTGHFASHKNPDITSIFSATIAWLRDHPGVAHEVDGSFLHLAVLVGSLRVTNLCQPPDDWASPWAGDYRNALEVAQAARRGKLLQLHYSGWIPDGYLAREEFLFSDLTDSERMRRLIGAALGRWSGLHYLNGKFKRGLLRRFEAAERQRANKKRSP